MANLLSLQYSMWSVESILRINREHLSTLIKLRPNCAAAISEGVRAIDLALEEIALREVNHSIK